MKKPALFLDRDGVINVDHAYVYRKENFEFVDGIFKLVSAAKAAGYLVVVITNQAGIGRGYYSEADFFVLMDWVRDQFVAHGGAIDGIYFCPYHPQHGIGEYQQESNFRKPAPGMILQAADELDIDLVNSILVGDKISDIEAGRAAGIGKLLHYGSDVLADPACQIKALSEAMIHLKIQALPNTFTDKSHTS